MKTISAYVTMKNTLKCISFLSLFPFILSGCTSTPAPISALPTDARSVVLRPTQSKQAKNVVRLLKQAPADYQIWLNQTTFRKARVKDFEKYLHDNQVDMVVPTYQLLRSARDWAKCGREPYAIPSPELWGNLLNTLKIFKYMHDAGILTDFEVTSVYRDYSLNLCAGGAPGSKHVYNSAIDFRIGPENPYRTEDLLKIEDSKIKLCHFWKTNGAPLNMGLGVYASGQIHIDTQGYRTWGPDHSSASSICHF